MSNKFKYFQYKNIVIFLTLTMFFVFDRILKFLSLNLSNDIVLIKNLFSFSFYPNEYISFSIPLSGYFLNILILILIILIIFYIFFLFKSKKYLEFLAWTSVLLGAISNFIDRIFFSYVIDYLDLRYFTIFNFADVLIVAGCFSLIFLNFKTIKK